MVGFVAPSGGSVFAPATLEALRRAQAEIRQLPNVDKTGLISVATENAIAGEGGDLQVHAILESGPVTERTARLAWDRVRSMPMMMGVLASRSGDTVTIIVPVINANQASDTYRSVRAIALAAAPEGVSVHVAGVAAMNGRLADMVNTDTKIFIPLTVLVVVAVMFVSLGQVSALVGPVLVIAASAVIAIGAMGWVDARYYLITTALPVVIMAIAVADCLHISTLYLRERSRKPALSARAAVAATLRETMLPVTLTSVTTVAGFAGLAIGSGMAPIREFGIFAAVGVTAAWALSLTLLPAVIILQDLRPVRAAITMPVGPRRIDGWIERLSQWSFDNPRAMVAAVLGALLICAIAASQARFDYERAHYFVPTDPVRLADATLNAKLDGLNFLDVVVTAPEGGSLMTAERMAAIAALKTDIAALPLVAKVTGIDDYVALMHGVLTDSPPSLPNSENAPAQYMLLYEASGDPGDFEEEIDYGYGNALIRAQLTTDSFSETRPVVDDLAELASRWARETGLSAAVSGRVAVNDGWMSLLAETHFRGLGLAVALVFLASAVSFRAWWPAALAMIPVLTGVVFVYAVMGVFAIDIAPATSMTAAISTGLGVDFGIHLISHVRHALARGESLRAAVSGRYVFIARACAYSALALALGLSVVCFSSAPPLRWFGFLVAAAAVGSLVGAILVIPGVLAMREAVMQRIARHA